MKRVFKIGERVWWEDDHMSGWGTIALVNGDDSYWEYAVGNLGDIITITKDTGGEIETTPNCVYQLAPGRQPAPGLQRLTTKSNYIMNEQELFKLTANKSAKDIEQFYYETFLTAEEKLREMCRKYMSRVLMDTSEDNKHECCIPLELRGTFGLSTLEMPHVVAAYQDPSEGTIWFDEDGTGCPIDFDNYGTDELVQIALEL